MPTLPLLLAGPIVRRVEPKLACVWVALSEQRSVELTLFEGDVTSSSEAGQILKTDATVFDSKTAEAIRVGDQLYVALVTWEGSDTKFLKPGTRYAYNVTLTKEKADDPKDLSSMRLLKTNTSGPTPVAALGYTDNMLPTFVTVPEDLLKLKIAHGSCRKPHGSGEDALAFLDQIIKDKRTSVEERPQQLFLTGDQIYADEVAEMLLPAVNELGQELIGRTPDKKPREHVFVTVPGKTQQTWPADLNHFPAARRQKLVQDAAKFTTTSGSSHLISFGEFCAMYVMVWSNAAWPEELTACKDIYKAPSPKPGTDALLSPLRKPEEMQAQYDKRKEVVEDFRKDLPKVRRVLANVATYMVSDDHEVTDDWYLTDLWRHEVLLTTLGRCVLANGLAAFGLFQAWGNDPKAFNEGKNKEFLDKVQELFPEGADGPLDAAYANLQTLCGMVKNPLEKPEDFVKWYFTVDGPKHRVIGLDTRNWRTGRSLHSPPALIARTMIEKQIAETTRPTGKEVTFVLSAAPVLGLPTIEEIIQKGYTLAKDVQLSMGRGGPGAAHKDPEPWSYDPYAVENLLERLRGHERIVFLSGDVHYSLSAYLDYWQKKNDKLEPKAVFVQLTSSALKNIENSLITLASVPIAQFVFENLEAPLARLVWDEEDPDPVTPPEGGRLPARVRNRLEISPVLLGTKGYPKGAKVARTPDRAWRFRLLRDGRPESERPDPIRHLAVTADFDPNGGPDAVSKAYADMLARHQHALKRSNPRLVLFDSNIGLVGIEKASSLTLSEAALTQFASGNNLPEDVAEDLKGLKDRPILEENFRTVVKAHLGVKRVLTAAQFDELKAKATTKPDVIAVRHRLLAAHPEKPKVAEVYTQQLVSLDLTTEAAPDIEIVEEETAAEAVPA